jgi:hypothetical protein
VRTKLVLLVGLTALVAAGTALAGTQRRHVRIVGIHYAFVGQLTSAPANGSISVDIVGGNHVALHKLLGQAVAQTFTYGANTEFLKWSEGVPTIVQAGDLAAGDYVRVNVRAPGRASLAAIERRPSPLVGDHGTQLYPPTQPLYLFSGRLDRTGDNSVTLDVRGGDDLAMRLLVGQSHTQTFSTGDDTIFLLWQGKVPTVISFDQLKAGDHVVVRVRAPRHATLGQVESTAAAHVGELEHA